MPSLGADMEEGTIIKWFVSPGDEVHRGDIVVEVETEKADMEVEIFQDGIIEELVATQGDTIPVGGLLARLQPAGARLAPEVPSPTREADISERENRPEALAAPSPPPPANVHGTEHHRITPTARVLAEHLGLDLANVRGTGIQGAITRADVERIAAARTQRSSIQRRTPISPLARRRAAELGVDPQQVEGTGPGGAVTAADVDRQASSSAQTAKPSPRAAPAEPIEQRTAQRTAGRQRVIANLMERSKREIPHYYLGLTIDVSHSIRWLQAENQKRPVSERILYSALLLKAVAMGVSAVPEVNGHYENGEFRQASAVNVGVAVSLRDGGLVNPAIQDVANKTLTELMADLRDVVQRARANRLRATEMTNATITVTNLGEQGVEFVHGIISPPQVAIVGFGKVIDRPWAENGMIGVRPTIVATLAGDHRVSNGHRGGMFLSAIARLLQEPDKL